MLKSRSLSLGWVAEQLGAVELGRQVAANARKKISGISTDSRRMKKGELFVALAGERFDGHDHAAEALAKGAAAVLAHRPLAEDLSDRVIMTPDTLRALGDLAGAILRRGGVKVVALTGSNGKTSVREMIASILRKQDEHLLVTEGNFNNLVGLPLTVFRLQKLSRLAVLEMGMNHFGEIERLTQIASPDVGLITSVGEAHLEFFGSLSQVAKAKGELFAGLKASAVAVVNEDEPLLKRQAKAFKGNKLSFGRSPKAQLRLEKLRLLGLKGQEIKLCGPGCEKGVKIKLSLLGEHNAHNALAAAAASLAAGASWDDIAAGLAEVKAVPGRLRPVKSPDGFWLLDDCYNANPSSMAAGLNFLSQLKGRPRGAVLGDMLELGGQALSLHRRMGRLAADLNLDFLGLVGPLAAEAGRAARRAGLGAEKLAFFDEPLKASGWLRGRAPKNAVVLIKGSHGVGLQQLVEALLNPLTANGRAGTI